MTGCSTNTSGSATVSATGGVSPYQFQWDDPFSHTGTTAAQLSAGSYDVHITDAVGCTSTLVVHIPSTIAALQADLLPISNSTLLCPDGNDGSLYVNIGGGTLPYSVNSPWQLTNDTAFLDNLTDSIYILHISDANGCILNDTFPITNNNFFFYNRFGYQLYRMPEWQYNIPLTKRNTSLFDQHYSKYRYHSRHDGNKSHFRYLHCLSDRCRQLYAL
ncbi:MAG: SprB repeat-containing protein [Bacteroidetes bacterium]|nr:SprB repeat-containing protein [Bacteroidota bacterium]